MSEGKERPKSRKRALTENCPNCGENGFADDSCPECGRAMCEKCFPMGPCALCQYERAQYGGKNEEDIWEAVGDMLEGWVTDDEWV